MTISTDVRCDLGENPLWDAENQCLYWTDIPAGRIHRFDVTDDRHRVVYEGIPVGGFTLQRNGELLLFRVNDAVLLSPHGTITPLLTIHEDGMDRFNDVIADPQGRVFAGTIGKKNCGLYRVDLDASITKVFGGTTCSNGMGFSLDLQKFYWTCSTSRRIFQFDYDQHTGFLKNGALFYEATEEEGVPDGLTVDTEGFIWSARWGGACIKRHSADGTVITSIPLPARRISSLCFGGFGLNELFVTSAKDPQVAEALAGAVFKLFPSVTGIKEFRSDIRTSSG